MTATGSISPRDRALAPDLARGLMLALIALANSVLYLYGRPYGRSHDWPSDTTCPRYASM